MPAHTTERAIDRLAALGDPVRRALYLYVARRGEPVSRDQAARGVRIARPLAAFHLDKLVEQGLLEASFRRLTRRRGPGAGRPAKLYRRSGLQLDLSLPSRDYELAARLFAGALMPESPKNRARVRRVARDMGKRLARATRRPASLRQVESTLREHGYEPFLASPDTIRLRNCPFDALVPEYRPLICGANQALLAGLLQGSGLRGCRAVADPQPGLCCVALKGPAR